jgi:hypothetical protein
LKKHFFTSAYAPPMGDAAYVLYIMYARLRSCFCGCGSSALGGPNVNISAFEGELLDFSRLVPLRALIASPCVEEFLLTVDLRARDLIELQDVSVDPAKPTNVPAEKGRQTRLVRDPTPLHLFTSSPPKPLPCHFFHLPKRQREV